MKLIGLVWAKAPSTAIAAQARRLKTLQRANGGWGQTPLMSPDAYATGQSLFALGSPGYHRARRTTSAACSIC